MEKVVFTNNKDWSLNLNDSLSEYRTTFCTPLGMSSYKFVFSKAWNLLVELEYKAYWATYKMNTNLEMSGLGRSLQLNELDEWIYKVKIKRIDDAKILKKDF